MDDGNSTQSPSLSIDLDVDLQTLQDLIAQSHRAVNRADALIGVLRTRYGQQATQNNEAATT